jgi:hypothetical protein
VSSKSNLFNAGIIYQCDDAVQMAALLESVKIVFESVKSVIELEKIVFELVKFVKESVNL